MSEKGLMILAKKNLLSGMKKGSLKRCAHCLAESRPSCIQNTSPYKKAGMLDLVQHGIRHQKTPPKTPRLNGLDIEKTNPMESQHSGDLIDLDPASLTNLPTQVEDEAHDDQHDMNENKMKWVDAMQDEMESLHENHYFELVKFPKGKRALKNRWVYRVKQEEHTSQPRYKARLVVKGFNQKKGIDFDEIFSPIVKMSSIRVVLGLAASLDLEIQQMDVKIAFLHGDLDKEIYMEQPRVSY
ncbi:hypothetical protein AAG906_016857 [Vitis piasezkii]